MKARVKETGEIVEVKAKTYIANSRWDIGIRYEDIDRNIYYKEDLDFENIIEEKADVKEKSLPKDEPDYWEKLKHQYAGMAMQGMLSDKEMFNTIINGVYPSEIPAYIAARCDDYATALVNRLKEDKS